MHVIVIFTDCKCWPLLLIIICPFFWAIAVNSTKRECSEEEKAQVRELLATIPGELSSWTQAQDRLLRNICVDLPGEFRAQVIERLRLNSHIDKQFVLTLWKYFFGSESELDSNSSSTSNQQPLESKHKYSDEFGLGEDLIKVCPCRVSTFAPD